MRNKVGKILSSALGLSLALGAGLFVNSKQKSNLELEAIGNYSTDASTYYNDITATSGLPLAGQLHDLITRTHKYYTSYADNGGNGYQKNTDQYYENGQKVSGYIYEFYSGVKWPNGWYPSAGNTQGGYNREHCWCQSKSENADGTEMWGEDGGGADMHHLRPVESRLNSTRSNDPYGEISNRDSHKAYAKLGTNTTYAVGGYSNGGVFEPLDNKKGDVARIILYTYLHYNSYTVTQVFGSGNATTNGTGKASYFSTSLLSLTKITNQTTEAKALEMLLEWNTFDPVDEIEQRRNDQVAIYQGNRNPFIDNANYANMIWGDGSSSSTPTVHSVNVSPSTLSLDLNGTTTGNLSATVNVSNDAPTTVTWTSSNTNVATVSSSGVVTAVKKGSCTITATSTYNSGKSGSCTVTVTDSSSSGGGGSSTETDDFTWDLSTTSYDSGVTDALITWTNTAATMQNARGSGTKVTNYYPPNYSQTRFYNHNTLTITPSSGYTITSIVFTASLNKYATAFGNSTWTNASCSVSSNVATVTPTNGSSAIIAGITDTCGFTSVQVYYTTQSGSAAPTLDSISLNTSNVQTEFFVGNVFDYSGLVVVAHYSDSTDDFVTPTSVSSPDMSSAGQKTVTVTYSENEVTKTETYNIQVKNVELDSIEVSNPKTEYSVGDSFVEPTVIANYTDDSSDTVSGATFSGYNLSNTGEQTVQVSYTEGGITKTTTFNITVQSAPSPSILLDNYNLSGFSGQTLSVTATYSNLTSAFTWGAVGDDVITSSSTTSTGTSTNGTSTLSFTLTGEGEKTLLAQGGGAQAQQCVVQVTQTTVSLNKSSTSIRKGGSETLTATTNVGSVSWNSSNTAAASVTSAGVVSVPSNATVGATSTITATSTVDSSVSATCIVTVAQASLTDVLTSSVIPANAVGSSTTSWGTASTFSDYTGAVYTGRFMGVSSSSFIGRLNDSTNGYIYTSTVPSNMRLKSVSIESMTASKTVGVYAQSGAYTAAANDKSSALGTITPSSLTYTFADNSNYNAICLRGHTSATEIGTVTIEYEVLSMLDSVTSSGQTTSFTTGDTFSYGGTLTAHYTEGKSDAIVTPAYFKYGSSGINPTSQGSSITTSTTLTSSFDSKYIYVVYTENNITKWASYQISVTNNPSLSWTAPNINTYSGTTLTVNQANSWAVIYNNGSGSQTTLTYNDFTIKLGGSTIALPYTWQPGDDGKTLCVSYNSLTTNTISVSIVQSIQSVLKEVPTGEETKTWNATSGCLGTAISSVGGTKTGTLTFDDASTMSYTRTLEYLAENKSDHVSFSSPYQQFGSSNALNTLVLEASNSATVTQIVVTCWAKNGATDVSVTVGGKAFDTSKSAPSAAGSVTFTGSATGDIVITMEKATKNAGCAQYIASVAITTSSGTTQENIANVAGHEDAQRAVVKFAKAFNTAMDTTNMCTANMSSAWSSATSAWNTFLSDAAALGETEEAYAKDLIKYATAQWTNDTDSDYSYCLERALATYEKCVADHGQTAFMSEVRSVGTNPRITPATLFGVSKENSNLITAIVIISMISVTSIGGYYFLRKRKED